MTFKCLGPRKETFKMENFLKCVVNGLIIENFIQTYYDNNSILIRKLKKNTINLFIIIKELSNKRLLNA